MTSPRRRSVLGVVGVLAAVVAVCAVLATGIGGGTAVGGSPLVGHPAPEFQLRELPPAQQEVRLSDLEGQVVLVNFWASWCAECRTEQDTLNRLWARYRDAGLVVVGVDFQDAAEDARAFLSQHGTTYPVVVDRDSETALAYGVRGIPETFLVGSDGKLTDRLVGPLDEAAMARRIETLLEEAGR